MSVIAGKEAMRARTYASTSEESAIVERVARIVSSVRGEKPNYARLAAELEQAVPFDIFGVVLLRHDRQAVRVTVCRREGDNWGVFNHQHPLVGSKLEQMLKEPELVVMNYPEGLDGSPAVSGDALSGSHQIHSTLIAPLMVEDRLLGTCELGSIIPNIYANKTLQRLMNGVARVLATGIEGAQLGGNAAIQDRQRQVLKDVTSALTSKIDLATILNQIVDGIANTLNVASAIIMPDRREGKLLLEAQSGLEPQALQNVLSSKAILSSVSIINQALLHRLPCVSQDIAVDATYPESNIFYTELGMRSIFCYPLVTGTTVYGVLMLCSAEPGGFTPLKTDILSLFASQATVAIQNGLLLESAHRRSRFQDAIARLEEAHRLQATGAFDADRRAETAQDVELGQLQEDLVLLARVREEAQRTFGVSFTSILRFISDHLLTQEERDLQMLLHAEKDEDEAHEEMANGIASAHVRELLRERTFRQPFAMVDPLSLLTQTAEVALVRTEMVGELSRLIMQLKQSANGVEDAWFVVDLNGVCIYMNPAAEALCQVRMAEMTASYTQLFTSLYEQDRSPTIEHVFVKLLSRMRNSEEVRTYLQDFSQGSIYSQELRCTLSIEPLSARAAEQPGESGYRELLLKGVASDYHYHFVRYPLQNQAGQLVANVLQVRDVTEQVRDENNRSALLSSVSHDLRTPLTTIKAAVTGLLQREVEWDEQDRYAMLEDIDAEADHLTVLVNGLVELSRIEMGALVLEKEWCDVVEIVYGTLSKMKRQLGDRPVHISSLSRLQLIYADHLQLERVFYHLLENAARHSPQHAEIVIELVCDGDIFRACVIDHGMGVPEQERERIFTSFYSFGSYDNGLGLAICKGIVDAHQGRIWVEAARQEVPADVQCAGALEHAIGARFIFTLPINPYTVIHTGLEAVSSKSWGPSNENKHAGEPSHQPAKEGEQ
jgi:signal transduction histidine kinase/GAF domain-containing protein